MDDTQAGVITAHTPDATAYHTGISPYGTTIPRATSDGGSQGFDPHKPGLVIVDPDREDGNLEVDFSKFKQVRDLNGTIAGAGLTPDGSGAFNAFSAIAGELEAAPALAQLEEKQVLQKETSGMDKIKLKRPRSSTAAAQLATTSVGEEVSEVLAQQSQLIKQLAEQVAGLHKEREAVVQLPDVEETQETREAEEQVVEATKAQSLQDILGMSFLGFPAPNKPMKEIYFEMPQAGTMGARYHEVIEDSNCITLVYDTRYEDGYQWIPPALGDAKIQLTLPQDNKTFSCSSLGINFHIGVLAVIVLFKHTDTDVNKDEY
jgi:hypothetical protein